MAIAVNRKEVLEPGGIYHVYNRAIGRERPFPRTSHYDFFMKQYQHFIAPMVDTFCYCLMPNHYHFLLRIKDVGEVMSFREEVLRRRAEKEAAKLVPAGSAATFPKLKTSGKLAGQQQAPTPQLFINRQFMSFFSSYTQAFNKQQDRKGGLFIKDYRRIMVQDNRQLINTVVYIHRNPVEAFLCEDPAEWRYSSFSDIISGKSDTSGAEVLSWFGDQDNFRFCHCG